MVTPATENNGNLTGFISREGLDKPGTLERWTVLTPCWI